MRNFCALGLLVALVGAPTLAQNCVPSGSPCFPKCGGEVNISGATLFQDFFSAPASTNDFIDADCDGVHSPDVEQLAPGPWPQGSYWWAVYYRATGSGNGLAEFVRSHLEGPYSDPNIPQWFPTCPSADAEVINRTSFTGNCGFYVPTEQTHLAVADVVSTWFITVSGNGFWNNTPTAAGYGNNPLKSWDTAQGQKLKGLAHPTNPATYGTMNFNFANPDKLTVYDTPIAWVPVAIIANRGAAIGSNGGAFGTTGVVKQSELQHLWVTGRMPTGENLVAGTRDSGSGTRNASMNTLGIDPSYARGDNLGTKTSETGTLTDNLGPDFQTTNMGGSSRMEIGVQNSRLGVGYTGAVGSSRAIADANGSRYEVASVIFDQYGATQPSRPTLHNVIHNSLTDADPNLDVIANPTAWLVGGTESFYSAGDPADGPGSYPMDEGPAKDYLNNIRESIAAFTDPNGIGDPNTFASPGQYLAIFFTLTASTDAVPGLTAPTTYGINPDLNPDLRDYTLVNNVSELINVPAYGAKNSRGPIRVIAPTTPWPTSNNCACAYPADGMYSDGTNGSLGWLNRQGGANIANNASNLNPRNFIAGDFNGDGLRNINDIAKMMQALYDVNAYVAADQTAGHSNANNPVIVEIIGDFNGDGNFDCRDARYFADGLALDPTTGKLNRGAAFKAIDDAWLALTGSDNNYFNTTVMDGDGNVLTYVAGASAADVAGGTPWPGAAPHGSDCLVNCTDIDYILANFGDFADINVAAGIDLSADMNGDLKVDCADVTLVQNSFLGGYCCSDNPCCAPVYCLGDTNCDGAVNFSDIDPFVARLGCPSSNPAGCNSGCAWQNADINGDGNVTFADIDPFVGTLGNTCP